MSVHWFMPNHALWLDDLEPFGVQVRAASGTPIAYYEPESGRPLVRVGDVTVYSDGRIVVWPREHIGQAGVSALLTTAEPAVRGKPLTPDFGWIRRTTKRGAYRRTGVSVAPAPDDALTIALRAAQALEPDEIEAARLRLLVRRDLEDAS